MSHASATRRWAAVLAAPFYLAFLMLSALFVGAYAFICAAVAGRSTANDAAREKGRTERVPWSNIALDASTIVVAYMLADVLRVTLRQNTGWPEQLEGYGSTLSTHLLVLGVLAVAWVIILNRIGWYHSVVRSLRWRLQKIGMATFLLTLTLATTALLFARDIYPRAQIGFFLVVLPIVSATVRGLIDWLQHARPRDGETGESVRRAW